MSVTRHTGNEVVIARIAKQSWKWYLRSTLRTILVDYGYRLLFKKIEPRPEWDCLPKRFETARLFTGYLRSDEFHQ